MDLEKFFQPTPPESQHGVWVIACNLIFHFMLSFPPFQHFDRPKVCKQQMNNLFVRQDPKISSFTRQNEKFLSFMGVTPHFYPQSDIVTLLD
jgi:hypothetical protein